MKRSLQLGLLLWLGWTVLGCATPVDELVPATVADDGRLPQVSVRVAGRERRLHLEAFGEAGQPVLLVFHGGWGSDFRALLPLQELSDRYQVVMWDARGSGLSERVERSELSERAYADEIHAVKQLVSPNAPVSLLGYSSGGFHAAIWLTHYPEELDQLVLVESDPFDGETEREHAKLTVPAGADWVHDYLWQNEHLTPDDHERADYKLLTAAMPALAQLCCDPQRPSPYRTWRLGALANLAATSTFDNSDFRPAMRAVTSEVLLVATLCGPLNAAFQRQHIAPLFAASRLVELARPADHLNLFDVAKPELLQALRGFLREYRAGEP